MRIYGKMLGSLPRLKAAMNGMKAGTSSTAASRVPLYQSIYDILMYPREDSCMIQNYVNLKKDKPAG